jgi:hypothetical protein
MKLYKPRVACSALCLILCVALIGVWVRSQSWMDAFMGPVSSRRGLALGTLPGRVVVFSIDRAWGPRICETWEWKSETTEVLQDIVRDQKVNGVIDKARGPENFLKVWAIGPGQLHTTPIWVLVLLCGGPAIVFPIR